jgi:hypothetical protein
MHITIQSGSSVKLYLWLTTTRREKFFYWQINLIIWISIHSQLNLKLAAHAWNVNFYRLSKKYIHLVNQSFSHSSLGLNEYYFSIPLSFSVCCLPFFANVLIAGYYSPMCNFRPVLCGLYLSFFPRVFFSLKCFVGFDLTVLLPTLSKHFPASSVKSFCRFSICET